MAAASTAAWVLCSQTLHHTPRYYWPPSQALCAAECPESPILRSQVEYVPIFQKDSQTGAGSAVFVRDDRNACGPLSQIPRPRQQVQTPVLRPPGAQAWTCTEEEFGEAAPFLLYQPLWPQSQGTWSSKEPGKAGLPVQMSKQ